MAARLACLDSVELVSARVVRSCVFCGLNSDPASGKANLCNSLADAIDVNAPVGLRRGAGGRFAPHMSPRSTKIDAALRNGRHVPLTLFQRESVRNPTFEPALELQRAVWAVGPHVCLIRRRLRLPKAQLRTCDTLARGNSGRPNSSIFMPALHLCSS
jgi:hypothetical protein